MGEEPQCWPYQREASSEYQSDHDALQGPRAYEDL